MTLFKVAALLSAALSWIATAGPIYTNADNVVYEANDSNTQLIALKNVDILGVKYDFTFSSAQNNSCDDTYSLCNSGTLFGDQSATDAITAQLSNLLIDNININNVVYNFDTETNLVDGCQNSTQCRLLVPHAINSNNGKFIASRFFNNVPEANDKVDTFSAALNWTNFNSNFVQYSPSQISSSTSVPEPASIAVFALSLLGLVTRRNIKK